MPELGGNETILVVEDDSDVRAYTTAILRELGYRVLEAHEGDTALGFLASEPEVELLFTDIGLPGPFNGRQLSDPGSQDTAGYQGSVHHRLRAKCHHPPRPARSGRAADR
jgi:CheY-like chemotaxis protein